MKKLLLNIMAWIHPSGLRYHDVRKTVVYTPWGRRGYSWEEEDSK